MIRRLLFAVALSAAVLPPAVAPGQASACGAESDCRVGDRVYRIAAPAAWAPDRPRGALVYAHGYKGSAAGALRGRALRAAADALGVAVVALQARGDDWSLPGAPGVLRSGAAAEPEAEIAYIAAVMADAAARFGLDRRRMALGGFSAGGMLVWQAACARGDDLAAGFIAIAGTYWRPIPDRCPGAPAPLVHLHGRSDRVVPIEGRAIGPARQGDVRAALDRFRRDGGYEDPTTEQPAPGAQDLTCRRRRAPGGAVLAFCTHGGGHRYAAQHLVAAWRLLQDTGAFARD